VKIEPDNKGYTSFGHLTKMQKIARRMAIAAAFVGVVIWFIKIVL
jgi:hypothetical protein